MPPAPGSSCIGNCLLLQPHLVLEKTFSCRSAALLLPGDIPLPSPSAAFCSALCGRLLLPKACEVTYDGCNSMPGKWITSPFPALTVGPQSSRRLLLKFKHRCWADDGPETIHLVEARSSH